MRIYELVLVLKTSLSEANRKKLLETIKSFLPDLKITKDEQWGQKPLAYSIKKEIAGHYLSWLFELKGELPKDFEKKLITNDNILRHLLLRKK